MLQVVIGQWLGLSPLVSEQTRPTPGYAHWLCYQLTCPPRRLAVVTWNLYLAVSGCVRVNYGHVIGAVWAMLGDSWRFDVFFPEIFKANMSLL